MENSKLPQHYFNELVIRFKIKFHGGADDFFNKNNFQTTLKCPDQN